MDDKISHLIKEKLDQDVKNEDVRNFIEDILMIEKAGKWGKLKEYQRRLESYVGEPE